MATRTIVTSQPDVACDVCERRLLRGEQHDTFLVAGRRRTVCELCAPRAMHQGWMRESEQAGVSLPPTRPRRGRSLLTRLRQLRPEPALADAELDREPALAATLATPAPAGASADAEPARAREQPGPGGPARERDELLQSALAIFNSSEHPRRVAGVMRSLGAPEVSVYSAEHAASVVRVVVAWELCWYRYQVDLDELNAAISVSAQGTELSELAREERAANALADRAGLLSLA